MTKSVVQDDFPYREISLSDDTTLICVYMIVIYILILCNMYP